MKQYKWINYNFNGYSIVPMQVYICVKRAKSEDMDKKGMQLNILTRLNMNTNIIKFIYRDLPYFTVK